MNLCILIPLLVGLLCALFGYLLGRLLSKGSVNWEEKVAKLEADLDECNKSKLKLNAKAGDVNIWRDKVSKLEADLNSSNQNYLALQTKTDGLSIWKDKVAKLETELASTNKNYLALQAKGDDTSVWKDKIAKLEADLKACKEEKISLESDHGNELNIWKNKVSHLKTDLEACNASKLNLQSDLQSAKASIVAPVILIPFNGDEAKAVFGKKIKQDDLKIIEGIGPKIEGLFHNFDIKTWKSLSETSLEKCQEVLNSGGDRYRIHNPGTWPKQAELAYEGKWAELLKWQDELDGGKA